MLAHGRSPRAQTGSTQSPAPVNVTSWTALSPLSHPTAVDAEISYQGLIVRSPDIWVVASAGHLTPLLCSIDLPRHPDLGAGDDAQAVRVSFVRRARHLGVGQGIPRASVSSDRNR